MDNDSYADKDGTCETRDGRAPSRAFDSRLLVPAGWNCPRHTLKRVG